MGTLRLIEGGLTRSPEAVDESDEGFQDEAATVVSIATASEQQPNAFEAEVEAALDALTAIGSPAPPPAQPNAYGRPSVPAYTPMDPHQVVHTHSSVFPAPARYTSPPFAVPPPMLAPPPSIAKRSRAGWWIAIALLVVGGGAALLLALVPHDDEPASASIAPIAPPSEPAAKPPREAPPPTEPSTPPAATKPPVADPKPPQPPEPPRPAATPRTAITSLEHPTLSTIFSPVQAEVVAVAVATSKQVKPGDALVTLRVRRSGSVAAARRVAELEALARQDPTSYRPFLSRARRELARQQGAELTQIKATAVGRVVARVKVGDKVAVGGKLVDVLDERTWIAVATVEDAVPTAAWSCIIATPDSSHTVACRIQATEALPGGGTRLTAEFSSIGAGWLDDPAVQRRIIVEPR